MRAEIRAFGSLAQEVMDTGVTGVVAMRYNVYVVTAAQFVADLYATLTQGLSLGEAVTLGRKQLHDSPLREIAYDPRPLQDWPVPVVYEAAPIPLFPKAATAKLQIHLKAGEATVSHGNLDASLPPQPDAGFFGRDETLLALDRAFDTQALVLLYAFAGSGKTTTAAEFARWYSLTGGVQGPVLFTSFEQYKPLARVLDQVGTVFGSTLEQSGVHWLALSDADRRSVALQVLKQIPVLWIWDNVEPVAGFPAGTPSAWSVAEQKELKDFLSACRDTKAKVLLTSRRDEQAWLGDLAVRIHVPPMPMQEAVQLARALAEKHNRRLTEVEDWRPLLQFTQGNPLTITVLVGQALREGLKTKDQIIAFVDKLRAGEASFSDETSEGRAKSLGASLSYGFEHAFTEAERKQLALLHFFQGFVNVGVLQLMGELKADWCLPEVRGLTREAGFALLDRAAEVGLLTAHGGGNYSIHPALPWYFKSLFERYYSNQSSVISDKLGLNTDHSSLITATRAFVEAMGQLGNYYHDEYNAGNRDAISALTAEEGNLLYAWRLVRQHEWLDSVTSTMQGLRVLYDHTGRRAEWKRLVEEIVPDSIDPDSDASLPGREEHWGIITEYRVRLATEIQQWLEAERLQHIRVEWERQRTAAVLALPAAALNDNQRNTIHTLAVSLEQLGQIQRERGNPDCVLAFDEAILLCQRIEDKSEEANVAFNLGQTYIHLPILRDLTQAERWYRRSLELRDVRDRIGRGGCLLELGTVAYNRLKEASANKKPDAELLHHKNAALVFCNQALDLLPETVINALAVTHGMLGIILGDAGDLDSALPHHRKSIRYEEMQGNLLGAARSRLNVAVDLANAGRLSDAAEYARAALRNFVTFGQAAAADIQETQQLLARIEEKMG